MNSRNKHSQKWTRNNLTLFHLQTTTKSNSMISSTQVLANWFQNTVLSHHHNQLPFPFESTSWIGNSSSSSVTSSSSTCTLPIFWTTSSSSTSRKSTMTTFSDIVWSWTLWLPLLALSCGGVWETIWPLVKPCFTSSLSIWSSKYLEFSHPLNLLSSFSCSF